MIWGYTLEITGHFSLPIIARTTAIEFFIDNVKLEEFDGKRILEVGSKVRQR